MRALIWPCWWIAVWTLATWGCSSTEVEIRGGVVEDDLAFRGSARVEALLEGMSLEDKVGEMTQLTLDMFCVGEPFELEEPHRLDWEKVELAIGTYRVGSVLNCGGHAYPPSTWHELIGGIQEVSMRAKGLPVLYGVDAIHGATYTSGSPLGPQQIALAATWDTSLVRKVAAATAKEVNRSGIPWNFSPVLDVGRDPRWPRFWETFGEDVKLVSDMGVSVVKGYQESPHPVAATLKHYVGYSMPWSGKDRTPAYIPERQLREIFLPPFQAAVDAGVMSVMVNSGEMNGIPTHANRFALTDLLRGELGFKGVVVTDWEDIKYLVTRHKIARSHKEAILLSISAGVDMSMVPQDLEFPVLLKELVDEGAISESRIDLSVRRILTMKEQLGLLDEGGGDMPSPLTEEERSGQEGPMVRAALECITLVKNEGHHLATPNRPLLPLGGSGSVFVTGPTAHSLNALNGGWSGTWQGTDPAFNNPGRLTAFEAMVEEFGQDRLIFEELASMDFTSEDIERVVEAIRTSQSKVVVLFLGEMPYTELAGNIGDLRLPDNQLDLVRAVDATGVQVVGVFVEGRPRTFSQVEPLMDAVVMAYLPGEFGGPAIAQVLSGAFNPSGRLPFTWPREASSHVTYDRKHTEDVHSDFSTHAFQPQYAFGHGLNYSPVRTTGLRILGSNEVGMGDLLEVEVTLENLGDRTTAEVVMLFVQDRVASITPSVDKLKAYKRVFVDAHATATVILSVPTSELGFIGLEQNYVVEPGVFGLRVQNQVTEFKLIK
ncbi:MAG: glycoside hydrolase family 3 C-terminal domain-containing protein [Bacteroidetes bacterium]|nr:glycoside hydrolase family 3 C-terminal domain-containing protein [Bacteroidota bacterium]MDA0903484.1 glycoside hydrolase family 3 C-terminal domain-containing protein [Bacteroidota bacterium]MDA1241931.1 glycoside hydrolase family 3 C-terminal domain-containing protein [Bacteroidota bacterium]